MPDKKIGIYLYDGDRSIKQRKLPNGKVLILVAAKGRGAMGFCDYRANGVAVLNATDQDVILDGHMPIKTGFDGPSVEQLAELSRLATLNSDSLIRFIEQHPNTRSGYRQKRQVA